jgi:hypothetical protein
MWWAGKSSRERRGGELDVDFRFAVCFWRVCFGVCCFRLYFVGLRLALSEVTLLMLYHRRATRDVSSLSVLEAYVVVAKGVRYYFERTGRLPNGF